MIIYKQIKIISIFFIFGCLLEGCFLFHPNVHFSITQIGDVPPSSANERLESAEKYTQEISIWFSQPGNSSICYFSPIIFVNKPYKTLHINEMSYKYDKEDGVFLSNKSFLLLEYDVMKNGWYWKNLGRDFFNVNFQKIFHRKEPGDIFLFDIIIQYSFDDEPLKEQILEYRVTTIKGEYHWGVL